jgi:hypothetical protein
MINYFKKRLWDSQWSVAIRPHKETGSFEHPMTFHVLKNTWRYWCADPFVIDHEENSYVFMELMDRLTFKGCIGYRVIENGKAGPIRVCLKTPFHMSYPLLFKQGADIYMMPECYESKKLTIYKATRFPDVWEPVQELLEGQLVCDTNYLVHNGRAYLLTMPLRGTPFHYDTLELYVRGEDGNWEPCSVNPMVPGAEVARNGGHFFIHEGQLIRPSQNCGTSYGENLVLNRVLSLSPDEYREEIWKKITVSDIRTDAGVFDGIHTYNASETYDVIDLRQQSAFQPALGLGLICNKLRRK